MKIAILSDVHANSIALESVCKRAEAKGAQQVWFLGDIVDRGPSSLSTLTWLRNLDEQDNNACWLIGNHDALLAEILSPEEIATFNSLPREDNLHHRAEVETTPEISDFVKRRFTRQAWEPKEVIRDGTLYTIVHASLTDGPGFFTYLYAWKKEVSLPREFSELEKRCQNVGMPGVMLYGHTHVPNLISAAVGTDGKWVINAEFILPGRQYFLDPSCLWLVNPGSVGQPRDLDNRAAFAILETSTRMISFHRVVYDWRSVARELIRLGRHERLPKILRDADVDSDTPEEWIVHYRKAKEIPDEL